MQEKADLKERVEELEHRCIQLSGETDTIGKSTLIIFLWNSYGSWIYLFIFDHFYYEGEYIALYQSQRAIMKQKHQEKEQYINMLAQDKEEMKVLYSHIFWYKISDI